MRPAEGIGEKIRDRNDKCAPGARSAWLTNLETAEQPASDGEDAGGEGEGMTRLYEVKHGSGERDQRIRPNPAGDGGVIAFIDFLEREPEKQGQTE